MGAKNSTDHGGENVKVTQFMLTQLGLNRGSILTEQGVQYTIRGLKVYGWMYTMVLCRFLNPFSCE